MLTRFVRAVGFLLISNSVILVASVSAETVVIDGAQQYQTIEGFGTCLVVWSDQFRQLYRTQEFQSIYIKSIGCNMLRVNMWGPTFEKPTEDWRQIRYESFDMEASGGRPRIFVDFGCASSARMRQKGL